MPVFSKTEKVIFIAAVIALMVFSYFLYDDSLLFPKGNTSELQLVGSIYHSQNDVRRKNLDTFSWLPADNKDEVFENDSIFTGDRSEAAIQLQDGSVIYVKENSLITLNMSNGQMSLDLRYGDLIGELNEGANLTIKSGDESFKLEGNANQGQKSKVEVKKTNRKNVNLKVLAGKAAVNSKPVQTGSAVRISKEGEVKPVVKTELQLGEGDRRHFLRINPEDPMAFSWSKKGGAVSRYELEVSPSADFSVVSASQYSTEPQVGFTAPLESGQYHWRVKAYDSTGDLNSVSPAGVFQLSQLTAPNITHPASSSELTLEIPQPSAGPLISAAQVEWEAMPQLQSFTWQLSDSEDFSNILKEETTNQKQVQTPRLQSGQYWVRVRGITPGQNQTSWSEPVPFALNLVVQKGSERPQAPVLVEKKIDFVAPSPSERNPAAVTHPSFRWKPVAHSQTYLLQVAKDKEFKEASRYEIRSSKADWTQYQPGHFYFRVYAKNANGLVSPPSEVGEITVTAEQPKLFSLDPVRGHGSTPTPRDVQVRWSEVPFAKSYLVEMDKSANFNSPTKLQYNTPSGNLTLPEPGTYHLRVQALGEDNRPLTAYSNVEDLVYSFVPPLQTPTLAEPFNNASIFLQQEMEPFIWLEWRKVDRASSYKLEISDRPDFSRKLINTTVSGNRFLIKERVPLGKIYWRVRAESKDSQETSDWAPGREFTIYHQKNEIFVK